MAKGIGQVLPLLGIGPAVGLPPDIAIDVDLPDIPRPDLPDGWDGIGARGVSPR